MSSLKYRPHKAFRFLHFDLENRPSTYLGQDFTTAEVTVVAACWADDPGSMVSWCLGIDEPRAMIEGFRGLYEEADCLSGHYITGHDLKLLNGALLELGMSPLPRKLMSDTYRDLVPMSGISKSQESMAEMYGVPEPKIQMSQMKWRSANRLEPEGIAKARGRAVGDVIQHIALRRRLLELGALRSPRHWP